MPLEYSEWCAKNYISDALENHKMLKEYIA